MRSKTADAAANCDNAAALRPLAIAPLLVVALVATAAAQTPEVPAPESWAALRVRYGAVLRRGGQTDLGPGLTYRGLAPTDFGAAASGFGDGALGGWLSLGRESFALLDQGAAVTSGALWRGYVGPGARLRLGPLEAALFGGYHYSQLPLFSSTVRPELAPVARQAVFGGARLQVALPALAPARGARDLSVRALDEGPGRRAARRRGVRGRRGARRPGRDRRSRRRRARRRVRVPHRPGLVERARPLVEPDPVALRRRARALAPLASAPPRPLLGGLAVSVVDAESGAPLPGRRCSSRAARSRSSPTPAAAARSAASCLPARSPRAPPSTATSRCAPRSRWSAAATLSSPSR